jgi:hypothetical protein
MKICLQGENGYDDALRTLVDEVLRADDLSTFLIVSASQGQPPVVKVVSGLGRYSAGLGAISTHNGKVFGFLGEWRNISC